MRKKRPSLLANRTITVSYLRNGLSLEVAGVPAPDGALVAKALLDAMRGLVAAGYEELTIDGASYHATGVDQPEEQDDADFVMPPVASPKPKTIGFQ